MNRIKRLRALRAKLLLEKANGRVTHGHLVNLAAAQFAGQVPTSEQRKIIGLAMKMAAVRAKKTTNPASPPAPKEEDKVKKLTSAEVRHHVTDCLRANPGALPAEVLAYVKEHGVKSVRRALGITAPGRRGGSRRTPKRTGVATIETPAPPASRETPAPEAVAESPAAPERSQAPPPEPASAPDVVEISTPGGSFKATDQGGEGWWHVEFKGPIQKPLMKEIMADLLRPVVGERAPA